MAIVGDHPESGVRFVLERAAGAGGGPPWLYEGHAFTPTERFAMAARVEADGTVTVTSAGASEDLVEKARLLFRALYKQGQRENPDGDRGPPRRVQRWRQDH